MAVLRQRRHTGSDVCMEEKKTESLTLLWGLFFTVSLLLFSLAALFIDTSLAA